MKNKEAAQFKKRLEMKGLGFARSRLFAKSNIGKDNGDCQKQSSCISFINKFIQLINSHTLWAKNIAKTKNSIEPLTRIVKSNNDAEEGIVNTAATDRSVKSAENTASVFEDDIISLINHTVSEVKFSVNREVNPKHFTSLDIIFFE